MCMFVLDPSIIIFLSIYLHALVDAELERDGIGRVRGHNTHKHVESNIL